MAARHAPVGPRSLRVRIMLIVGLCWLLPTLALGGYLSGAFYDALRTKTEQALVASAAHAQDLVVQNIEDVLRKSKDVTYDGLLTEYVTQYQSGEMDYADFYVKCRTYWHRMFQREPMMPFTAFFLTGEAEVLLHTVELVDTLTRFQQQVMPRLLEIGRTLDTRSRFVYVDGGLYHVRNLNYRMERYGMLALCLVPEQLLSALLDEDQLWHGNIDILLDEYAVQADPGQPYDLAMYEPGLAYDGPDIAYSQQVQTSDYTLTYRIRLDGGLVYGQVHAYFRVILLLLLLLLPLEALIMFFVDRTIIRPLVRLADATGRMARGQLGITVQVAGEDEIGRLGTAFNAMSLRMEQLIDKSYREELALRDAHIAALQSRINPHFLNNALELMNWQARLDGAEAVSQMVEALSTLINAALDRANERMVTLGTEVEVADAYFFFIRQRYGDRVRVEKTLEEALREVPVPRLIIQTLLENAVEHGIGPVGRGVIRLDIYRREDMLYVDVRNDGHRISPGEEARLAQVLADPGREAQGDQMGLRNVSLRLRLIYHGRAVLCVRAEGEETLARITIPYGQGAAKEGD